MDIWIFVFLHCFENCDFLGLVDWLELFFPFSWKQVQTNQIFDRNPNGVICVAFNMSLLCFHADKLTGLMIHFPVMSIYPWSCVR